MRKMQAIKSKKTRSGNNDETLFGAHNKDENEYFLFENLEEISFKLHL